MQKKVKGNLAKKTNAKTLLFFKISEKSVQCNQSNINKAKVEVGRGKLRVTYSLTNVADPLCLSLSLRRVYK